MAAMEPLQRPRSKSNFSFKSDKSHKSQGSIGNKPKESAEEKRRSHLSPHGKANPNAAINEAQPIAAALEKPTMSSLRSFTHVDAYGNSIAEPDLSNPTRPRWERPLDTIKSFEAAIDTEYKRRSMIRADTAPDTSSNYQSRRSSYYGGHNDRSQRSATGGYYGSGVAPGNGRDTYAEPTYGHPVAGPPRSRYNQRMMSDPMSGRYGNGQQNYGPQTHHNSRDTVNTGVSGSGSEPWGNSTDPSSDNSSVERIAPVTRPDPGEQYGFAGFGGAPIMEEYRHDSTSSHPYADPQAGYWPANHPSAVTPPAPPKHGSGRKPIPLSAEHQQQLPSTASNEQRSRTLSKADPGDKRKSWFKRKFSKD